MRISCRLVCHTLALLALHARASFAQPSRARPASGQVVLPQFRATIVRSNRDTAWFVSMEGGEGATRLPVVAFAPATGHWIGLERSWREIEPLIGTADRSGSVAIGPYNPLALGGGHRLVLARDACPDECAAVEGPSAKPLVLRFAVSAARRRALYREGGGSWPANRPPPRFESLPSLWATDGTRLAFAFGGESPLEEGDTLEKHPPAISGILIFDMVSRRLTSAVHSALIATEWSDIALAGGRVFAVPRRGRDVDADDSSMVRLASYDPRTGRWKLYRASDLPTRTADIDGVATDGRSIFIATADALTVLDAKTGAWRTRFYADSSYRLPDGADTLVTTLALRQPPVPPLIDANNPDALAAADSAFAVEEFVRRLAPRHRTAFHDLLVRLVPIDTVEAVIEMDRYDYRGHEQTVDGFDRGAELASIALARRELVPFLREATWRAATQPVASSALRRLGDRELVAAWRSALDSGTAPAGFAAADSLLNRGDSVARLWLRRHAPRASEPTKIDGPPFRDFVPPTPTMALAILARHGDTASIAAAFAAVPKPDGTIDHARQSDVLWALMWFRTPDARRRVAAAVEERPWLWDDYLAQYRAPVVYQIDTLLTRDPDVRAIVSRIEARQAMPTRPPARTHSVRVSSSLRAGRRDA